MANDIKCMWCGAPCRCDEARWICGGCYSMGYLSPPEDKDLYDLYQVHAQQEDSARRAMGGTSRAIARSLLKSAGWYKNLGSTLEVGAGQGIMTDVLLEAHPDILVIEPHSQTDFENKGVEWVRDISEVTPGRTFDWILLVEVFEHLLDPVEFIKGLGPYLSIKGKLLITTPNAAGRRARRDGFQWSELQNPTHIHLFSPVSFEAAVRSAGYTKLKRMRRPVAYKNNRVANVGLGVMQLMGIDGGLRYLLSEWKAPYKE